MKRACVMLRNSPAYRQDVFLQGLSRLGYDVTTKLFSGQPGDVLVMWNRYRHESHVADRFEAAGGRVLIAENGYIGTDDTGGKLFALARTWHNGPGTWPVGEKKRWLTKLHPWRSTGDHVLLLPQRGIGPNGKAMPSGWVAHVTQRLRAMTRRPIRVRPHPGIAKTDPYDDLLNAWAAVTWGSGAAIKALYFGYPVFYELKDWIGAPAAVHISEAQIEQPYTGDREAMFERLAWAQWSTREIETGEAFKWLLG